MKYDYETEFSLVSEKAIRLDFLQKYLPDGDSIHVNPMTGFVTSSRRMSAEDVVTYWSDSIFPDKSEESYSAHNPFAQARLFYVMQSIAKFLNISKDTNLRICDFATGEGVLLDLLRNNYPKLTISGTEHSLALVETLKNNGFDVYIKTLGIQTSLSNKEQFDISTLTWTLANAIDPLALLQDVVKNTKTGGYVCVAESSRILVPFRKSLSDYFSKTLPADLHPSNFSANTLKLLMQLAGLEIVFVNRYFDSDVLLIMGKKVDYQVEPEFFDDQMQVVKFMKEWQIASDFFENLRSNFQ
jgi:2-polyprenyl-3-methyl-5-hydroxy-6-metoxy-1,4-benzoquinol methylase